MQRIAQSLVLATTLFLTGCSAGGAGTKYSPGTGGASGGLYESSSDAPAPSPLAASIFPGDQAVMTNAQIEQVLAARVIPPARGRVVIVRMGPRYRYSNWSEDLAALEQQTTDGLLTKLRASPRVSDALVLPSLLVPTNMTVPYLREAAARVQADSILVYRTFSQTYAVSRLFSGDETRAYCTVEALLLDTRTGIITTTSVGTQNWSAKRTSGDINLDETIAKAEQAAIGRALNKVGDELAGYLKAAPMPADVAASAKNANSAQ